MDENLNYYHKMFDQKLFSLYSFEKQFSNATISMFFAFEMEVVLYKHLLNENTAFFVYACAQT